MKLLAYDGKNGKEFLTAAEKLWRQDPVFNNLQWALGKKYIPSNTETKAAIFTLDNQHWIALHTVPERPLIVNGPTEMPAVVSDAIFNCFPEVPGLTVRRSLAEKLTPKWGRSIKDSVSMYLYELATLDENIKLQGRLRAATLADRELLADWIEAFATFIREKLYGRNFLQEAESMIEKQQIWLFEVDGKAVSMAGSTRSEGGVACINYVYTPEEWRGRGFASSSVGWLSKHLLLAHDRVCLYADEDYPSSNRVYQKLGYQVVARTIELDFG